jgi:hypothetical protein
MEPNLNKIATRKKQHVAKETTNNNWIHSIVRLNTPVQLSKYLEIWDALASLQMAPCNILVFEARNREEINVCIAFMHRKSGEFCAFK